MALWTELSGAEEIGSYINGEVALGSAERVALLNPSDGRPVAEYLDAGRENVDAAVASAERAQQVWSKTSALDRSRCLIDVARRLREIREPLAKLEAISVGKPLHDARVEADKVAEMFEYYAGWCDKLHGEVIPVPSDHLNYTRREPHGVIVQITPGNAPLFTAGWQLAPALATGNASVLKPSELTPLSSIVLARVISGAGAPAGLANVLAGLGPTTAAQAIAHRACAKVVFVGSLTTGREIARLCARKPIPCILELGGKSANIVFDDAPFDAAVAGALAAGFGAAGQSCVAGSRLLVARSLYERFVQKLAARAAEIQMGHPLDETVRLGPLGSEAQYMRVRSVVDACREVHDVRSRTDGVPAEGFYVAPTIVSGLSGSESVARDELFGPVVAAIAFDDEEDAVATANDTEFGLAGAVWTSDVARAHRVASRVRAGTFWVNGYKTLHVSSPFGGSGASGYGRSSGIDALHEYTRSKSVWVNLSS